ncbi:MAG: DMT family transporter [Ruminococcaceae bacterium]|nr:DMT family transporter [Oscillospiraceae bacterium]
MSRNLKGNLLLVLAAFVWGISFVMQDLAALHLSPFSINGIRSLIGTAALTPLIMVMSKKSGRPILEKTPKERCDLLVCSLLCGIFLCIATNFQQFGIALYPDGAAASGRTGFITALYVVIVPIISIFFKKRASLSVWLAVVLATVGMCLLCLGSGAGEIYIGDAVVLCCAFAFALQILCIDKYADRVDGVKLSALQFFICGVLSLVLMFIFEKPSTDQILKAMPYLLYLGVMSCGAGYTLQIIGQQYSKNPTVASILMSLESVFAALAGVVLVGERFTIRETLGCIIMFAAIILSQLPSHKKSEEADG